MTNQYTAFRFVDSTHKECSLCGEIKLHVEFAMEAIKYLQSHTENGTQKEGSCQ